MCPVIATFKYNDIEDALRIAQANLDVEGRGHSVSFHTNNKEHAEFIGEHATVCRVLINQVCSTCNGGAFSNGLSPQPPSAAALGATTAFPKTSTIAASSTSPALPITTARLSPPTRKFGG